MVRRVVATRDSSAATKKSFECTCEDAHSSNMHNHDCPNYPKASLNRMKPPIFSKTDINLRRPEGLWPHAKTIDDIDTSSPEEQLSDVSAIIERFMTIGEYSAALYWIDVEFAKKRKDGDNFILYADYIMKLHRASAWSRIISFTESRLLHETHLIFAHFYISALYALKMYNTIVNAKIGHLIELEPEDLNFIQGASIPLRVPNLPPHLQRSNLKPLSAEEKKQLDDRVKELKLLAAFLARMGKTFLALENRTAALRFIWSAWLRDKSNMEVEELIHRYNLAEGRKRAQLWEKYTNRRTQHAPTNDPRSLHIQAQHQYSNNNVSAAYEYTKMIMEEYGLYRPALLMHINCAVATKDILQLFTLAHDLVDKTPDDEISWYAVAMYYFVIENTAVAKNFMNKTTMMNRAFGEAWVAFGHILSAENEHEQAMNCYLKALRLLDRHQDLFVFLSMEYCRTNNVKWALDFLKEPQLYPNVSELSNKVNPYREHEKGCVHYAQKQYSPATHCFVRALRALNPETTDKHGAYFTDHIMALDPFWEPLIANLAQAYRRMGAHSRAIMLFNCALAMNPNRESSHLGVACSHICAQDCDRALFHIHRTLNINPYNQIARDLLHRCVQLQEAIEPPRGPPKSEIDVNDMKLLNSIISRALTITELPEPKPELRVTVVKIDVNSIRSVFDPPIDADYERHPEDGPLNWDALPEVLGRGLGLLDLPRDGEMDVD